MASNLRSGEEIMNFPKKIMLDEEDPYNIGGYSSSDDGGNERYFS